MATLMGNRRPRHQTRNVVRLNLPDETVEERYARSRREEADDAAHAAEAMVVDPRDFPKKPPKKPAEEKPLSDDEKSLATLMDEEGRGGAAKVVAKKKIPEDNKEFDRDIRNAAHRIAALASKSARRDLQTNNAARLADKYGISVRELDRYLGGKVREVLPEYEKARTVEQREEKDDEREQKRIDELLVSEAGKPIDPDAIRAEAERRREAEAMDTATERTLDERAQEVVDSLTPEERAELERAGIGDRTYDIAREALSFGGVVTGRNLLDAARMWDAGIDDALSQAQAREDIEGGRRTITREQVETALAEQGLTAADFIRGVYAGQPQLLDQAVDTGVGLIPFVGTARDLATGAPAWQVGLGVATDLLPVPAATGIASSAARRGAAVATARGVPFDRGFVTEAGLRALGFTRPTLNPRELAQGAGDIITSPYRATRGAVDPSFVPTSALLGPHTTTRIPLDLYTQSGVSGARLREQLDTFEAYLTPEGRQWLRDNPAVQKLQRGEELTVAEQQSIQPPAQYFTGLERVHPDVRELYGGDDARLLGDLGHQPKNLLESVAVTDASLLAYRRMGHATFPDGTPLPGAVRLGAADTPERWIQVDPGRASEVFETPTAWHATPSLEYSQPAITPDVATREPLFGGVFVGPEPYPRFMTGAATGGGGLQHGAIAFTGTGEGAFFPPRVAKTYQDVIELEFQVPGGALSRQMASLYGDVPGLNPLTFGGERIPLEASHRYYMDMPTPPTDPALAAARWEELTPEQRAIVRESRGRWPAFDILTQPGADLGRTPGAFEGMTGTARTLFGDPADLRGYRVIEGGEDVTENWLRASPTVAEYDTEIARLEEIQQRVGEVDPLAPGADASAAYQTAIANSLAVARRGREDRLAVERDFAAVQAQAQRVGAAGQPLRAQPAWWDSRTWGLSPEAGRVTAPPTEVGATGTGRVGGDDFERFVVNPGDFPRSPATPWTPPRVDVPLDQPPVTPPVTPVIPWVPPRVEVPLDQPPVTSPPPEREVEGVDRPPAGPFERQPWVPPPPPPPICVRQPWRPECRGPDVGVPSGPPRTPPPPVRETVPGMRMARAQAPAPPPAPAPRRPSVLTVTPRVERAPEVRTETRLAPVRRVAISGAPVRVELGGDARIVATSDRPELGPRATAGQARRATAVDRTPRRATTRRAARRARVEEPTRPRRRAGDLPDQQQDDAARRGERFPRVVGWRHGYDVHTLDLATGEHDVEISPEYSAAPPSETFRVVSVGDTPPREHVVDIPGPREFRVHGGGVDLRADTATSAVNRPREVRTRP